jgi:hypothetical protein
MQSQYLSVDINAVDGTLFGDAPFADQGPF